MRATTLILAAVVGLGFVTFMPDTARAQGACTGAAPSTINAIRHTVDGHGAVTFAIPLLELAVSGLRDQMSLKVRADGHQLLAMDYSGGNASKFWFENCIRQLPRPRGR